MKAAQVTDLVNAHAIVLPETAVEMVTTNTKLPSQGVEIQVIR